MTLIEGDTILQVDVGITDAGGLVLFTGNGDQRGFAYPAMNIARRYIEYVATLHVTLSTTYITIYLSLFTSFSISEPANT